MEIDKNNLHFENILSRMKIITKAESDKDVAIAVNMKPSAFANRKKRGSMPLTEFIWFANTQNVNIDWLINGRGPIYNDEFYDIENERALNQALDMVVANQKSDPHGHKDYIIVEEEHINLIKNFKDKPTAKEVNEKLIDLERMSEKTYRKVVSHINEVWETVTDVFDEIKGKKTNQKNGTDDK